MPTHLPYRALCAQHHAAAHTRFADYTLRRVADAGDAPTFTLAVPSGAVRVRLCFLPEGLVLLGDEAPGIRGVIASPTVTRAWFAQSHDAVTLAQYVLRLEWSARLAHEDLRRLICRLRRHPTARALRLRIAWRTLQDIHPDALTLAEADAVADAVATSRRTASRMSSYAYAPEDLARLVAIHARFHADASSLVGR